jgi:hypothetical protein
VVVGQVALGHDADHPPAVDEHRAVEETALGDERCADDDDRRQLRGGGDDVAERLQRRVQQRRLAEQVLVGIGGETELGEDDDCCALAVRGARQRDCRFAVGARITHAHVGHGARDAHEAVVIERV